MLRLSSILRAYNRVLPVKINEVLVKRDKLDLSTLSQGDSNPVVRPPSTAELSSTGPDRSGAQSRERA